MMIRSCRLALALLGVSLVAVPAAAEIRLVETVPAASATASKVDKIILQFSAPIVPASLAVDLTMTGMPGMAHHDPMKVTGFASTVSPDSSSATLTLPRTLPAGTYQVHWRAAAVAGDSAESMFGFTVR
jgi:methionine-rich copper-binding protein CopC